MNDIVINTGEYSGLHAHEMLVLKACKPATAAYGMFYDAVVLRMRLTPYITRGEYPADYESIIGDADRLVRMGFLQRSAHGISDNPVYALTPAGSDMLRDKVA